jgi:hypothetical protein
MSKVNATESNDDATKPQFRTLAEAVDFIAARLEANEPEALMQATQALPHHLDWDPDYPSYFIRYLFTPLEEIHRRTDLRALYADREFPQEDTQFKLGGHMAELGCTHIDFERHGAVWHLHDIWMCR